MTGPVERVPLTDEQRLSDVTLDYWAGAAETAPPGELGTVNFPAVAKMLIAELRASRAREQELTAVLGVAGTVPSDEWAGDDPWRQGYVTGCEASHSTGCEAVAAERDELRQRIDGVLAMCDRMEHPKPGTIVFDLMPMLSVKSVRAALTGTYLA